MQIAKITKITPIGKHKSMDITINNKHHLFFANGIATSNSHAVSYAMTTYSTAYAKTHFSHRFYRSYLSHAKDKMKPLEEIDRLVSDAKQNDIYVCCPDLCLKNKDFEIHDHYIYFGIGNIKGIGEKVADKIIELIPEDICSMSWTAILFDFLLKLNKSAAKAIISTGGLDFTKVSRKKMLYQHDCCLKLKPREVEYIRSIEDYSSSSVEELVLHLSSCQTGKGKPVSNSRRLNSVKSISHILNSPPFDLGDKVEEIVAWEGSLLGTNITCSRFDTINKNGHETDCGDFDQKYKNVHTVLGQVKRIKNVLTKNGEEMAFCSLSDDSGEIENVVIFPKVWDQYGPILSHLEILRFIGIKKEDSFIINKVEEIH